MRYRHDFSKFIDLMPNVGNVTFFIYFLFIGRSNINIILNLIQFDFCLLKTYMLLFSIVFVFHTIMSWYGTKNDCDVSGAKKAFLILGFIVQSQSIYNFYCLITLK